MSHLPCNFTERSYFIQWANTTKLNVTQVVEECQPLCALFYGTGNPDISGIGVMIAYYLQVAITVISGPILIIIELILKEIDAGKTSRSFVAAGKKIHGTVTATNAFFAFSLVAASVARWRQGAFLFEIMFMKKLNQLQIAIVILSGGYCLFQGQSSLIKDMKTPSNFMLAVVMCALWGVFFSNAGHIPWSTRKTYQMIIAGCVERWGYERLGLDATNPSKDPPQKPESALHSFLSFLESLGFIIAFYIGIFVAGSVIIIVGAVVRRIVSTIHKCIDWIRQSDNPWGAPFRWIGIASLWLVMVLVYPFDLAAKLVAFCWLNYKTWMSIFVIGVLLLSPSVPVFVLYSYQLAKLRNYMQSADSAAFGDNQWGFGQITAVLLWGPVLMQLIDIFLSDKIRQTALEEDDETLIDLPRNRPPTTNAAASRAQATPPTATAVVDDQTQQVETHQEERASTETVPSGGAQPPPYSPTVEAASPTSPQPDTGVADSASTTGHLAPPASASMTQEQDLALAGSLRKRATFDSTVDEDIDDSRPGPSSSGVHEEAGD